MVKNYLPNIPITIPGSIFIFIKEPLKIKNHNKKNLHMLICSNNKKDKDQHTTKNKNYIKN